MKIHLALHALIFLAILAGCGKNSASIGSGNARTIQARGVSYVVPWETSDYNELPGRFTYNGESISFSEIGGNLTVDGKLYGKLKTGDQVSLLTKGVVIVNGATRQSVSSTVQP